MTKQATWLGNDQESPHKSLLNNQKLWKLIVGALSKSGNQIIHKILYNSPWCNGDCGEYQESSRPDNQKLDKLCVTRWTIRAKRLRKILDNYEALLELWEQSLKKNLEFETKSRIGGCKSQIKLFKFYFGL